MREYLKYYRVTMRTLAPVFVGSGREIGKKEYIFLNRSKVGIPDIQKLYAEMRKRGLGSQFEDYLLGYNQVSLTDWFKRQNIRMNEIEPIINYKLDCGDAVLEKGGNRLQVMECIKDPYGKPYIPGSSLKGMFRTIFLGADMLRSAKKYGREKTDFLQNMEIKKNRSSYLKREMNDLEGIAFRTLQRERTKPRDAVNDILQGFVVSDSEPLSVDDLVLCQKVDWHTNGIERKIPILRECIKPNITIRFNITVDTQICSITKEEILGEVKDFIGSYNRNFEDAFSEMGKPGERDVFLGGGCGFVSKTVLYPLLGKEKGLETAMKIFEKTNVPRQHKHFRDKEYGASPHMLKCTKYQGRNYQMGLCRIEKMECVE